MSANDANPVGEVPEPPADDNGVNYESYASATNNSDSSAEGLNFSSKDIAKREKTEFFTNVEGAEKRAREAERERQRKEVKLREQMLKEAEKTDGSTKKTRSEEEKKSLRETEQVQKSFKQKKIRAFIWGKRKIIIAILSAVAVAVLAIIFVPMIISAIQNAKKEAIISEGRTDMLKVYTRIMGNSYSREELENILKEESDKVTTYFGEISGEITSEDDEGRIKFSYETNESNEEKVCNFEYSIRIDGRTIFIYQNAGEFDYYNDGTLQAFSSAKEAVDAFIVEREGWENE